MPEIERQVVASSDDCHRRLTTSVWNLTHKRLITGAVNGTAKQLGNGMRFTNITIGKGATINQAYLTFRCSGTEGGQTVRTRISAEDVDDAPTFANDAAAFDARWANRTTARVDWDSIPAWTLDEDYNSLEIKSVIQEVIDRAGWASGNDIVIFWEDFEDRSDKTVARRLAYSYDGSVEFAPKLVIDYTPPAYTIHEKEVTDGIALTDNLVKTPMLFRSDGLALSDVLVKTPIKTLVDGIAFKDILVKLIDKRLTDAIAFKDTLVKTISKTLTDGIAFKDVISYVKNPTKLAKLIRKLLQLEDIGGGKED
ncbi:hypothetical protein ES708_25232 [subsurface metagenome]